jgi:glycosyltransferase involved in cell wall biosynthesis
MKILLLTQYFPPEVGAPQNRLFEIGVRLSKKNADVTVLTAMPNYPEMKIKENYRNKLYFFEKMEGLKVHRAYIYVKKSSSILFRLLNYFSFVFSSIIVGLIKLPKADYLICESPPLFLGISALIISKFKGAKLIFNVSDLWPETAEKLGIITNPILIKISTILEELLYKNSFLISGQTQGIVSNISKRFPAKKVYWLKNGVDLNYFAPSDIKRSWRDENYFSEDDFILLYAGILGHAQGLETIIFAADILKDHPKIKFVILGDGPEKQKLINLKIEKNLNNIFFLPLVPKEKMHEIISSADASIVPLKKIDLFKGAIPSKIFEILALERPILLGIEGEAKELFITQADAGLFFEPENFKDLSDKILMLYNSPELRNRLGKNGRKYVRKEFNREIISDEFFNLLKSSL